MIQNHTFDPIYDENSKILILGSFPSVKSRITNFYYGNPHNRFWTVISDILNKKLPHTIDEKTLFLLNNNIALWDVISSCNIEGSADSSIKQVIPNDISKILDICMINAIFTNGKKAHELYNKLIYPMCGKTDICLPSTSPANASYSLERLLNEWKIIVGYM